MPKIVLLQFDTDADCAARREALSGIGATIVEGEPRWPTFFDIIARERPDIIVIACTVIPQHGREAARYLGDGFNTRDIPVVLTDVAPRDLDATRKSAPKAQIVSREGLAGTVSRLLKATTP
jgi:hypothetical protein